MRKFGQKNLEKLLEAAKRGGLVNPSLSRHVTTNWVVFTGTYSAGKTTLVQDISEYLGVPFHQEPARQFIEKKLAKGSTSAEIWSNIESTVMPIHKLRVDLEYSLDIRESILLDTAIPDTLPYALLYGTDPKEIIRESLHFLYKEPIFLVEPLFFESDKVRKSDSQERMALHYLRKRIYIMLGYRVVSVPVLGRIERRDFVLRHFRETPEV